MPDKNYQGFSLPPGTNKAIGEAMVQAQIGQSSPDAIAERNGAITSWVQEKSKGLTNLAQFETNPRRDPVTGRIVIWASESLKSGPKPTRFGSVEEVKQARREIGTGEQVLRDLAAEVLPQFATVEEARAFYRSGIKSNHGLSAQAMNLFAQLWPLACAGDRQALRSGKFETNQPIEVVVDRGPIKVPTRSEQDAKTADLPMNQIAPPEQVRIGDILAKIASDNEAK